MSPQRVIEVVASMVASVFRLSHARAREIIADVREAVQGWRVVASSHGLARAGQERMRRAFRKAER